MKHKKRNNSCGYQLKRRYKNSLRKTLINELLLLSKKDIDDLAMNIPILSKKDRLFVESENPIDTYINNTVSNNDIMMPNGYISVSILLLKLIQHSNSNLVKDSYIFPALFCLRQYLELTMKKSLLRFRNGETKPYEGEGTFITHDLIELWNKLKKHIDQIDEHVECIEQIVKELNEVDNDGTAFKYDNALNTIVRNKDQKKLNNLYDVDTLIVRILQLYSFFDGIDYLSYECLDCNE